MTRPVVVAVDLAGSIVEVSVSVGDVVIEGEMLGLVESMKLHHEITAPAPGVIVGVLAEVGSHVAVGDPFVELDRADAATPAPELPVMSPSSSGAGERSVVGESGGDPDDQRVRDDLAEVLARHRGGLDRSRPDAVAKRRERGRRTARENIADLIDIETFVEYGALAIAAQASRRSHDDLVSRTPADGMVAGIGALRPLTDAPEDVDQADGASVAPGPLIAIAAYDYTVMAGTQGHRNHHKKDRLFSIAADQELPVVIFTEGGGGRPGDTDTGGATGLDSLAFGLLAELSGRVPLVAVNAGYCFAGNAALLGVCDVVIATRDSNIGMAGPAMIAGGGLGEVAPSEIGPIDVQARNGVVDIVADDEADAVQLARRYLSYFIGPARDVGDVGAPDPQALRAVVPTDRMRAYKMSDVIAGVFDLGSVLELRAEFGRGIITALAMLEGRPAGVLANNPSHLSGAIDSDGSDKAARFMQLCDAHGLPLVSFVDTPGMMVGPDVEATGLVRHCSRLFVHGANLTVPLVAVVTRKAYGLGAQAMMGGSTKAPLATLAWPTGEFGPMGLEGAVELGYRGELDACTSIEERDALFDDLVGRLYQKGKALSIAEYFEIDDVIDPAATRSTLSKLLNAVAPRRAQRPHLDTW